MRASIVASIGSILTCDFLFIPPRMQFAWTDARKTFTFLAMIVVAAVISWLSERLRFQEMVARRAAGATKALYELNVELSGSDDMRHLASVTGRHFRRLFGGEVVILLRGASGELDSANLPVGREELALAERAWVSGDLATSAQAGRFSMWVPVLGIREPLAVIGLEVAHGLRSRFRSRPLACGVRARARNRHRTYAVGQCGAPIAARCRDRADA